MIGIYKITNIQNGKSYIGQSIDIKRRWREHIKNSGNQRNSLYVDFAEIGTDNFNFEVLEECSKKELDEKEKYWIKYYDTFNNGYNLTTGGQAAREDNIFDFDWPSSISSKGWTVYYYLLSISLFNDDEQHRYVYKNTINISQASRDLKISRTTFYSSIDKLEKEGLIQVSGSKEYYRLPIKSCWAQLSRDLLTELLAYSTTGATIDLLRTYLFCNVIYSKYGNVKRFTKRNLVRCLNHNDTDTDAYRRVQICLDLLEKWGLVVLNTTAKESDGFTYEEYIIKDLSKESGVLDKRKQIRENEMNSPLGLTEEEIREVQEAMV